MNNGIKEVFVDTSGGLMIARPINPSAYPSCKTTNPAWRIGGNEVGSRSGTNLGTCYNYDLILKANNTEYVWLKPNGMLGIGNANPLYNLDVSGSARVTGSLSVSSVSIGGNIAADKLITSRITAPDTNGVHIGDSSMTFQSVGGYDNMRSSQGKISIGNIARAFGANSIAIGVGGTETNGNTSFAFGWNVKTGSSATRGIAIGSGFTSNPMVNNTANSLAVGFNSTVPTFFVSGGNGTAGSFGNVGIGTTNPQAILDVSNGGSMRILGNSSGDIQSTTNIRPHFATSSDFTIYEGEPGSGILRLKVNAGGNASIGNSNNTYPLDVTGTINSSSLFRSGGATNYSLIGWNAANNILDGYGASLLINYGSGKDVAICTGSSGGVVSAGKNLEIGLPTRNTAVALNIKTDGTSQTNAIRINDVSGTQVLLIASDGKTKIGTYTQTGTHSDALLTIYGKAVSKSFYVTNSNWADYVFKSDYKLMSLDNLREFIAINGHLPEVPTSSEISKNGNNLGETDVILLKKIEELTLYVLELELELKKLKSK